MSTAQCEISIIRIWVDLSNDILRFNYNFSPVFYCLLKKIPLMSTHQGNGKGGQGGGRQRRTRWWQWQRKEDKVAVAYVKEARRTRRLAVAVAYVLVCEGGKGAGSCICVNMCMWMGGWVGVGMWLIWTRLEVACAGVCLCSVERTHWLLRCIFGTGYRLNEKKLNFQKRRANLKIVIN